jgi:hypothetical protein
VYLLAHHTTRLEMFVSHIATGTSKDVSLRKVSNQIYDFVTQVARFLQNLQSSNKETLLELHKILYKGHRKVYGYCNVYTTTHVPYILSRELTDRPSSRSGIHLETPTFPQLAKKLPTFYVTRRFITVYTTAHHMSLPWSRLTQSTPSQRI